MVRYIFVTGFNWSIFWMIWVVTPMTSMIPNGSAMLGWLENANNFGEAKIKGSTC